MGGKHRYPLRMIAGDFKAGMTVEALAEKYGMSVKRIEGRLRQAHFGSAPLTIRRDAPRPTVPRKRSR